MRFIIAALVVASCAASLAGTPKPRLDHPDAGQEVPLVYDSSRTVFRMGPNGILVPYYESMPVAVASDGGWTVFNIIPSADGGIQVAGCQLEIKTTRGNICCHQLTCTEAECKFTRCERTP